MSEVTHEILPGEGIKPVAPKNVKRAWFDDEQGYRGEPIEYGGQLFYASEVPKPALKQFGRETQRLEREGKALGLQQTAELEASENGELSPEREEYYEQQSERIVDELNAAYDALLDKGIVGWDLPRPFSQELLHGFAKADKVALCQAIGQRSTTGLEASKNSARRLKR